MGHSDPFSSIFIRNIFKIRVEIFSWLFMVHYCSCVKCNDESDVSLIFLLSRKNSQ